MAGTFRKSQGADGLHVAVHSYPEVDQPGLETYQVPNYPHYPEYEKAINYPSGQGQPTRDQRRILGLRVSTFCLSIALIGAIIAAVLAGILASKPHCQATSAVSSNASMTTMTTTTTITASPSLTSTPSSQCISQAGQDWISPISHLKYTRACNTDIDSSHSNLFTAYQPSLDTCVAMCDTYNYWTNSTNVTVAAWNWQGKPNQTPGLCWCVHVNGGYTMKSVSGQDSALRVGSFGEGTLPS